MAHLHEVTDMVMVLKLDRWPPWLNRDGRVGALPVYASIEEARKAWPDETEFSHVKIFKEKEDGK